MIQAKVLSHLDLDAPHEKSIDIPRVPLSCRIAVFVRFVDEPHGNSAVHGGKCGISVSLVRNPIHDDVDFLIFLIEICLSPKVEILAVIKTGRKIECGIDREGCVFTCQWASDVTEVPVPDRIRPNIVVLSFKTLNQRLVVGEICSFVDVVNEWRCRYKKGRRKISSHEFKSVLSYKQHHLPMQDAAVHFIPHRNSRGL
jgi:hypothetical protein